VGHRPRGFHCCYEIRLHRGSRHAARCVHTLAAGAHVGKTSFVIATLLARWGIVAGLRVQGQHVLSTGVREVKLAGQFGPPLRVSRGHLELTPCLGDVKDPGGDGEDALRGEPVRVRVRAMRRGSHRYVHPRRRRLRLSSWVECEVAWWRPRRRRWRRPPTTSVWRP